MKRMINFATAALLKLSPNSAAGRKTQEASPNPALLLTGKWTKRYQEEIDGELITFIEEIVFKNARTGRLSISYPTRPDLKPTPFHFTYVSKSDQLTLTFTSKDETEPLLGKINYTINGKWLTISYGNKTSQTYLKKSQFLD